MVLSGFLTVIPCYSLVIPDIPVRFPLETPVNPLLNPEKHEERCYYWLFPVIPVYSRVGEKKPVTYGIYVGLGEKKRGNNGENS